MTSLLERHASIIVQYCEQGDGFLAEMSHLNWSKVLAYVIADLFNEGG
jgi:hypothetical protein